MKKWLVLSITFFILALPLCAQAALYTFSGTDEGGIGSAVMGISTIGNTLTATIRNTSPTDLIGAVTGTGGNSPGITGFGFNLNLDQDGSDISWELEAYYPGLLTTATAGDSYLGGDYWVRYTTAKVNGVTMDYLFHTDNGINGALYNPATLTDPNNTLPGGINRNYFTTATLTMTFRDELDLEDLLYESENYYVRMQNVGSGGEGSLKLYANPIPEPATMLLLGSGLVGFALVGRRKFFKKG